MARRGGVRGRGREHQVKGRGRSLRGGRRDMESTSWWECQGGREGADTRAERIGRTERGGRQGGLKCVAGRIP